MMKYPLSRILATYLISAGVTDDPEGSASIAWPVYYSTIPPDTVLNCVMLFDERGTKDGRSMRGQVYTHPGCQLMVQTEDYDLGWDKGREILALFDAVVEYPPLYVSVLTSSYHLKCITRDGDLIPLPGDQRIANAAKERRRELFSCHFRVSVDEVS